MAEKQKSLKKDFISSGNWLVLVLVLLPVIVSFFQLRTLDNDFFFLYPTGKYIVNNGFPHTDMLSMHSNMKIIVQQWLSTVIFYFSYSRLGETGVFALLYLCYFAICALTFRLNYLITKNKLVAAFIACISEFLMFEQHLVTRPQMFTYLILLAELCLLEKYVQTKKIRYLAGIPLLSVALINLHAAMWTMLFIFMLPYIVDSIPVKIKSFKHEASGSLLALFGTMAVSVVAGFLNPYGFESMAYIMSSYGQEELNSTIAEMLPATIDSQYGKYYFALLLIIAVIVLFKKNKPLNWRFFCLFFGTLVLAIMHMKALSYFFLYGLSAFSYMLKDVEFKLPEKIKITKLINTMMTILLVVALAFACANSFLNTYIKRQNKIAHYRELDEMIDIINKREDPVVLFTNFNDGQYFEYNGLHPYIDGRAELFLVQNNNDYDYFGEYFNVRSAYINYREFIDKYGFTYISISKDNDRYMYMSLIIDDDFKMIYETDSMCLFVPV